MRKDLIVDRHTCELTLSDDEIVLYPIPPNWENDPPHWQLRDGAGDTYHLIYWCPFCGTKLGKGYGVQV